MAGRPKGKYDLSPFVRHNTLKAIREVMHREDKRAHEVIADVIQANGLHEWLKVASKFNVKESRVEGTVSHKHEHTEPRRDSWRLIGLSQAAKADPCSC